MHVASLDYIYTFQISFSEYCPRGSILLRTVPWKRTGSWGIIPNRDLRSWRPTVQISIPSTTILPAEGSINLNNTWMRVDFPLPVRPTTPIFSPPWMVRDIPFRTRGVFSRYRTCSPPFNNKDYIGSSYWMHVNYLYVKFIIAITLKTQVSTTQLHYMSIFLCIKTLSKFLSIQLFSFFCMQIPRSNQLYIISYPSFKKRFVIVISAATSRFVGSAIAMWAQLWLHLSAISHNIKECDRTMTVTAI